VPIVKLTIGLLAAIAIAAGATLIAIAVGLLTWVGTEESVMIPEIHVPTTDGMILAEDIEFLFADARFVPDLGTAMLRVRSADGTRLFAGVTDRLTAERFLGDGVDPADQGFWLTSDRGTEAALMWDLEPGTWTFVVVGEGGATPTQIVIDGEISAAPFRLAAGTVGALGTAAAVAGGLLLVVTVGLGRGGPPPAPAGTRRTTATVAS
jgi:hypothetical protein